MKETLCTMIGILGSIIASLFGGWDSAFITLLIFMAVDFATGLIVAAMGNSDKSESGKLNSNSCWKGLAKKVCVLMLLVVAVRLDILLGTTYVRDAVCIGFCCNELISIIENTGLMGVNYPQTLKDAIELLQGKSK
jgi:toxin secretion/phage lysis holin